MLGCKNNVFNKKGNRMKKSLIILGSLVIVLTFAVSGYSKNVASRKLAQKRSVTDTEIGPVKAFERTFEVNFEDCKQNLIRTELDLLCNVTVAPPTEDELDVLAPQDLMGKIYVKQSSSNKPIEVVLAADKTGYGATVYGSEFDNEVSDEEFLAAIKKLFVKFPKASIKIIKIVR